MLSLFFEWGRARACVISFEEKREKEGVQKRKKPKTKFPSCFRPRSLSLSLLFSSSPLNQSKSQNSAGALGSAPSTLHTNAASSHPQLAILPRTSVEKSSPTANSE